MRQGLIAAELDSPERRPRVPGSCRDGSSGRVGLARYRSPGAEGHMIGGIIGAEGAQNDVDPRFALPINAARLAAASIRVMHV